VWGALGGQAAQQVSSLPTGGWVGRSVLDHLQPVAGEARRAALSEKESGGGEQRGGGGAWR
jgi:hypothetical protein